MALQDLAEQGEKRNWVIISGRGRGWEGEELLGIGMTMEVFQSEGIKDPSGERRVKNDRDRNRNQGGTGVKHFS